MFGPLPPSLPNPGPGLTYMPGYPAHVKGYRGEHELAHRINNTMPLEQVVYFANRAGQSGPDLVSIGPTGIPTLWDSKYRSSSSSIGRGSTPFDDVAILKKAAEAAIVMIRQAMDEGRLEKSLGNAAIQYLTVGNFAICTVGTGNAHGGVVEHVCDWQRTIASE